jgi:hypothetical protein
MIYFLSGWGSGVLGRGGKVVPAAVEAAIDIAMAIPEQFAEVAEPVRADPLADGIKAFNKAKVGA